MAVVENQLDLTAQIRSYDTFTYIKVSLEALNIKISTLRLLTNRYNVTLINLQLGGKKHWLLNISTSVLEEICNSVIKDYTRTRMFVSASQGGIQLRQWNLSIEEAFTLIVMVLDV